MPEIIKHVIKLLNYMKRDYGKFFYNHKTYYYYMLNYNNGYKIALTNDSYTNKIFKEISKYDIKMFSEEDPSLNEIFLSVVGENYE